MEKAEGYVYFIKEYKTNTFKIGKAKNLENRLKIFSVKLPFKWEIIHSVKSKNYSLTEKLIHQMFQEKRIKGTEWFELNEKDLEIIKTNDFPKNVQLSIKGLGVKKKTQKNHNILNYSENADTQDFFEFYRIGNQKFIKKNKNENLRKTMDDGSETMKIISTEFNECIDSLKLLEEKINENFILLNEKFNYLDLKEKRLSEERQILFEEKKQLSDMIKIIQTDIEIKNSKRQVKKNNKISQIIKNIFLRKNEKISHDF